MLRSPLLSSTRSSSVYAGSVASEVPDSVSFVLSSLEAPPAEHCHTKADTHYHCQKSFSHSILPLLWLFYNVSDIIKFYCITLKPLQQCQNCDVSMFIYPYITWCLCHLSPLNLWINKMERIAQSENIPTILRLDQIQNI